MVKATSILGVLYAAASVIGLVLLVLSVDTDNTTDVVIGTGALILGVLGAEAQSIIKSIEKSREARQ